MTQCKKCQSTNIIMIEYSYDSPFHYDGVSEYMCRGCGQRVGRWSGKILEANEAEFPLGQS